MAREQSQFTPLAPRCPANPSRAGFDRRYSSLRELVGDGVARDWTNDLRIGPDSDPSLLAAPVQRAPGLRAGVLAVRDYDHTVYDHVGNSEGILHGVLEGRLVEHCLGIEDGDVRRHAGAQYAAVGEAGDLGGGPGLLAIAARQRSHFFLRPEDAKAPGNVPMEVG